MCGICKYSSRRDKNHDFFKSFGAKKINELVVTSNKLNNFAGLVTSGLESDVARGLPVGPHSFRNLAGFFRGEYRSIRRL
jgi:hypothetical protein